jgi:hypothetical protein
MSTIGAALSGIPHTVLVNMPLPPPPKGLPGREAAAKPKPNPPVTGLPTGSKLVYFTA